MTRQWAPIDGLLAELAINEKKHWVDIVRKHGPALVCDLDEHLNRPTRRLRRFRERPWRCQRCGQMFVSVVRPAYDMMGTQWPWYWKPVDEISYDDQFRVPVDEDGDDPGF